MTTHPTTTQHHGDADNASTNYDDTTLLTALWAHMGFAIFVAQDAITPDTVDPTDTGAPQTQLRVVGQPPSWLYTLFPEINQLPEANQPSCQWYHLGPFLENFALDAEEYWAAHAEDASATPFYSGFWIMQDNQGQSYTLEAIVAVMAGHKLLLVDKDPRHYGQTQDILQRGRRMMLSYEKLERQPYFDAVTGLYTVHGLSNLANERWLNQPDHQSMMVLNITIQNNDFLNEVSMDESALIETARLIRQVFSPSDLAARIDTHHFKVILSDADRVYSSMEELKSYIHHRQSDNTLYPLELAIEFLALHSESQLRELLAG